jgi:hypothetical protein
LRCEIVHTLIHTILEKDQMPDVLQYAPTPLAAKAEAIKGFMGGELRKASGGSQCSLQKDREFFHAPSEGQLSLFPRHHWYG